MFSTSYFQLLYMDKYLHQRDKNHYARHTIDRGVIDTTTMVSLRHFHTFFKDDESPNLGIFRN